jgi:hypothetical protein
MARLRGYGLRARDGAIGQVVTVLFDQTDWTMRYFVVDTETWMPGRVVGISPHVLGEVDIDRREIRVHLARGQVRAAPEADALAAQGWRSTRELAGLDVMAHDQAIGTVADVVIDDAGWHLRYLVVALGHWLPLRKTLLPPEWVQTIDWTAGTLSAAVEAEVVRSSPAYSDGQEIDRATEERLFAHYGRPVYW